MNDSQFNALADAALEHIQAGLEASGADVDFAMVSAGVLEIEFADHSKIIVNRHAVAKELWVAARSGGFHFRWDGAVWRDTRNQEALMPALSLLCSAQAGRHVDLNACDT